MSDIREGLQKTKRGFFERLTRAIGGKSVVSDDILDNIEDALIASDMGVDTTLKVVDALQDRVERDKYMNFSELVAMLREEIASLMENCPEQAELPSANIKPYVIMVVGVNGVGKTTTVGKLSAMFGASGRKVVIGAADTFRAAAVDQLAVWAERAGADFIRQQMGSDPASVASAAVSSAKAKGAAVVIIDTAGRLHHRIALMNELTQGRNVRRKVVPDAPHEVLRVLDAATGQNALQQAKQFAAATDITAIALTKLDGSARGGVVVSIADQMKVPVKYIGVGEGLDDLKLFNRNEFIAGLFDDSDIK